MRAEQEVLREAARLFPRLVRDAGYLGCLSRPGASQEALVGVFTRRNGYARPVAKVEKALLECFCARGWVEAQGERWVLTEAGLSWLRRRSAGAEPFREQHELRATELRKVEDGSLRPLLINQGESPIGWLRRRKGSDGSALINTAQFEAAERLRTDFTRAQLAPRVTSAWDGGVSSRRSRRAAPDGPESISETALAAKQRFTKALDAVGPELAGVLVDVCCLLRGLEDTEKSFGWPRRSGKAILQIGLAALARHYGLSGVTGSSRQRMRHWGSEDYRPSLDYWRDGEQPAG